MIQSLLDNYDLKAWNLGRDNAEIFRRASSQTRQFQRYSGSSNEIIISWPFIPLLFIFNSFSTIFTNIGIAFLKKTWGIFNLDDNVYSLGILNENLHPGIKLQKFKIIYI